MIWWPYNTYLANEPRVIPEYSQVCLLHKKECFEVHRLKLPLFSTMQPFPLSYPNYFLLKLHNVTNTLRCTFIQNFTKPWQQHFRMVIIPTLGLQKLATGGVKYNTTVQWQNWESNPVCMILSSNSLIMLWIILHRKLAFNCFLISYALLNFVGNFLWLNVPPIQPFHWIFGLRILYYCR